MHCGCQFVPDPRTAQRQRYCARPVCVQSSRAAARRKWRRKGANRESYSGLPDLVRMQEWRRANPGYWHRRTKVGDGFAYGAMADVVREFASRDLIDLHFSLVAGLVSHLLDTASRDEIATEIRRLILLGHELLHEPPRRSKTSPRRK